MSSGESNPLHDLLGGSRGALDSALPSIVFITAFLASSRDLAISLGAAMVTALGLAGLRLWHRERPVRVLGGVAAVAIAAVVAARTGSASDYFLPSLLANTASALVWAVSILAGWPMLGIILGFLLGQRTSWRRDPDLMRAYSRASWIWAASFLLRAGINLPLYLSDNLVGLGVARVLLGWPLVLGIIASSWWLIQRSLPPGHPGIRHPRTADPPG
jgi:hypothetical protein